MNSALPTTTAKIPERFTVGILMTPAQFETLSRLDANQTELRAKIAGLHHGHSKRPLTEARTAAQADPSPENLAALDRAIESRQFLVAKSAERARIRVGFIRAQWDDLSAARPILETLAERVLARLNEEIADQIECDREVQAWWGFGYEEGPIVRGLRRMCDRVKSQRAVWRAMIKPAGSNELVSMAYIGDAPSVKGQVSGIHIPWAPGDDSDTF